MKERERENLLAVGLLLNGHNVWGWASLKLGTRSQKPGASPSLSCGWQRGPIPWSSCAVFQARYQEAGLKVEQHNLNEKYKINSPFNTVFAATHEFLYFCFIFIYSK